MSPDNQTIYDQNWQLWLDMKVHGPASRWLRSLIHSQIKTISDANRIRSVLDVGCGEGTISYSLAKWLPHANVMGVDFSSTGIQCAESRYKRPNLQFIHDLSSRQLATQHDLVTCFEVLEHVEAWENLLQRIADSARQFVLLSFPTGRMRSYEKEVGHLRNFAAGEVEQFMARSGFERTRILYAGFPFYSPLYRELCNLTHAASNSFSTGTYGTQQKLASSILYPLFRYFSTRGRFGDQFCGLFHRASPRS
jgi:trans-aconitate methyltransferase